MVVKTIFKLYEDKTSIKKSKSRLVQGGNIDQFPNRLGWWEKLDLKVNQKNDIVIHSLPKCYEYRADLLAEDMYGRSDLEWVILQYNNIVDIQEEFIVGAKFIIPNKLRLYGDILVNSVRIVDVES